MIALAPAFAVLVVVVVAMVAAIAAVVGTVAIKVAFAASAVRQDRFPLPHQPLAPVPLGGPAGADAAAAAAAVAPFLGAASSTKRGATGGQPRKQQLSLFWSLWRKSGKIS